MAKLHHAGFFDGDDGDASLDEDKFAPAEGIRRDINLLLPALPKLRAVEVAVIGERESDLDSTDSWYDDTEEKIVYEEVHTFHIRREGKKVEAVDDGAGCRLRSPQVKTSDLKLSGRQGRFAPI